MRQAFLTYAQFEAPTCTPTSTLSQPRYAHVSAHTTALVNQCSADLRSRSGFHKRLLNRSPLAFRNSFTMLLQIPTSIHSEKTLLTTCTLQLGKGLVTVYSRIQYGSTKNVARQQLGRTTHTRPHRSQLQLVLVTRSTSRREGMNATCFAGRIMNM